MRASRPHLSIADIPLVGLHIHPRPLGRVPSEEDHANIFIFTPRKA